jgi:hypothetical protein
MLYARRDRPPEQVKVNKGGAISMLSIVRHLNLPDDVTFDVVITADGAVVLTPIGHGDGPNVAEVIEEFTTA